MENLSALIEARKSIRQFDPSYTLSEQEIKELLALACKAPSSSNLQSWRFVVASSEEAKGRVPVFGFNQNVVDSASAVICVVGDCSAHRRVEEIYEMSYKAGYIDAERRSSSAAKTFQTYDSVPLEEREKIALFDAGLVSMQLMLLAKDRGLDTLCMGGFDKQAFAERFELAEDERPIVLIAIGKAASAPYLTTRLPIDSLAKFY